jgi:hypothetical protein
LPHVDDIRALYVKAAGNIFAGLSGGDDGLLIDRLFRIWREDKILEIIFLQLGFHE